MNDRLPVHEPHKIKTVRLLHFPTLEERRRCLADARFNVFHLGPSRVTFDMCSNATNAMSQEQVAGQFIGDEAYAGARNFETLEEAVGSVFGHSYTCPAHNILGCLKLVIATMAGAGDRVAANHATWLDLYSAAGLEPSNLRDQGEAVFTGNIDLAALERWVAGDRTL